MTAQLGKTREGHYVHANGIDTYYIDTGEGVPLILLYNGMISTSSVWNEWPSSYARYIDTLAKHYRVIATDFRGSGKTVHTGGPIPYDLLADDVIALIDELDLDRPLIGGYGDGGMVRDNRRYSTARIGTGDRERRRLRPVQPRPALCRPHHDPTDARRQRRRDPRRS